MASASPTALQRSRSHHELVGDKTLIKAKPITVSNRVLGASPGPRPPSPRPMFLRLGTDDVSRPQ
jgi:hypothetical protein